MSTVHISAEHIGDCELSVNFFKCSDPYTVMKENISIQAEMDVRVEIESAEMLYGNNVIFTINDICDECKESFYIPNMTPTG